MSNLRGTRPGALEQRSQVLQKLDEWQQAVENNNQGVLPQGAIAGVLTQWLNSPDVQQTGLLSQAYRSLSTDQRGQVAQALLDGLRQAGVDPKAAGLRSTSAKRMSVADLAQLTAYAGKNQPDVLRGILNHPIISGLLIMVLIYVLRRRFGGADTAGKGGSQPGSGSVAPPPPSTAGDDHNDNVLTQIWHRLFGGDDDKTTSTTVDRPINQLPRARKPDLPREAESDLRHD